MDNTNKIILHLCADIGSDSYIYRKNGYDVRLIGKEIGVENYTPPKNVYGIIANPVCSDFSIAKAKYKSDQDEERGLILVKHCERIIQEAGPLKFYAIENPARGTLKKYLGKPDFIYQPWMFGSPWTKETALWGKFNTPLKTHTKWEDVEVNEKLYVRPGRGKSNFAFLHKSAIHNIEEFEPFIKYVKNDSDFRSLCSQRFAQAFYKENK